MTRNPKQESSNLYDCRPQVGLCPINCNQCFYNRPGAFYSDINKPDMPTLTEVGNGIVRMNCGHDSNIEKELVVNAAVKYKKFFFNTSIAKFNFPGPVVWTANREEEKKARFISRLDNVMFIRLRVSSTNMEHIREAIRYYSPYRVPLVLTFMAYYDGEPPDKKNYEKNYEWKKRHINNYWCPTKKFMIRTMNVMGEYNRLVTMCGTPESNYCRECRNCETYYWQFIKRAKERKVK